MKTVLATTSISVSRRTLPRIITTALVLAYAAGSALVMAAEPVSVPWKTPVVTRYFIGIVGNPSSPDISWSDDELTKIKALGVNMVQLSIAWGGKPANEVLNLEDLDVEQRAKFAFRITTGREARVAHHRPFWRTKDAEFLTGPPRLHHGSSRPGEIREPAVGLHDQLSRSR